MEKQSNLNQISDGILCEEILKTLPDLITVVDKDFILRKVVNANSGNSFFPSSMIPGRNVSENLDTERFVNVPSLSSTENHQFAVNPIFDGIKECFETGKTIEKEYAVYLNEEILFFEGRYKKINNNHVVCIERNITKRKKAEIILYKSRLAFSEVMNTMPIPVFIKDINNDLRYIFWNNTSEKELGLLYNDVIGKTDVEIYGAERGGKYTEIDNHVMETNELYQFEDCYETPDGEKHNYLSHKMVIKNDIINWLLTARWDITGILKTQKELEEAKEAAEASDRLKSVFISNMTHEIRTPLNAIVGFSELMMNAQTKEEKKDFLSIIKSNNELLLQLINDILDLSKIEANILEFVHTNININDLFEQIVAISNRRIGESKNLIVTFTPPLEKCVIRTERNRLRQVMMNLVNNAIKFTSEGSINIGYEVLDNSMRFFISDTGMGIPQEKKEEIFKRFVKLNSFIPGSGLGLSISQTIIQKLGGNIGVDSTEGEGSTFWFTLPVMPIENGMSQEEKLYFDNVLKVNSKSGTTTSIEKPMLLVAEDSPDNYKLFYHFLQSQYDIIHAWDGEEAVELYDKHSEEIETILMDIRMPVIDGYEATRQIRKRDRETPIIAVSAYT